MKELVTKWFGVLLLEDGRVAERSDFPTDAHAIAERLLGIRRGEVLAEERALARPGLIVHEARLKPLGKYVPPERFPDLKDVTGEPQLLREATLLVGRDESRRAAGEQDRFVVQAVRALDEVHKTVNTLMERLRDWYALHFPEALQAIQDPAKLARVIAEAPDRPTVAARVPGANAADTIGAEFTPEELASVQSFARSVLGLFEERNRLEPLIERETNSVAPTLSALVGPLIAAKLLAHAGSLERLAFLPASTVQTLGAEEALFSHLKEGTKPPKHGVLFQHALVNTAPYAQRGRLSRLLAGHASIAARLDFFASTPRDRSADLRQSLEAQILRVRGAPRRDAPRPRSGPRPGRRPPGQALSQRRGARRPA